MAFQFTSGSAGSRTASIVTTARAAIPSAAAPFSVASFATVPVAAAGFAAVLAGALIAPGAHAQDTDTEGTGNAPPTVAHEWTDALLFAIRRDLARPVVHARNLYHVSAAMYDAWALYDERAATAFLTKDADDAACGASPALRTAIRDAGGATDEAREAARRVAIGHAAWRLLDRRFGNARRGSQLLANFELVANGQGLERGPGAYAADDASPAATGARVAACLIVRGLADGSNEADDYANLDYAPLNSPLDPTMPGNPGVTDPNRWQSLQLDLFIDQSGNVTEVPGFLGANWGSLTPFALAASDRTEVEIDGLSVPAWLDPGPPPRIGDDPDGNAVYAGNHALVATWSSMLDPADGRSIDISPGAIGNLGSLADLPTDPADILALYDGVEGDLRDVPGTRGHALNPATGEPYAPNVVPRGDYTRVLAEFWADGPDSETPPGHWFGIYNEAVVGNPAHVTRIEGRGEPVDALRYDVVAYLALGGAMHDSAIAAWSTKRAYDSMRPIGAIRYMAGLGQSTDATAANYAAHGIPLVDGLIETVLPGDPLAGTDGRNVGKIKGLAWRGPDAVRDPRRDVAGVDWILLENWWPYQRPSFVTPPFAGYVSGHSTFSRAAAEVLTRLTGDAFFPGGLGEFLAPKDDFLVFEQGPSVDVRLQWATYRDAADQTSLSRIWGGIHPPADDLVGRRMGEIAGIGAWTRARALLDGDGDGDGVPDANPGPDPSPEPGADPDPDPGPSPNPKPDVDPVEPGGNADAGRSSGGGGCSIGGPPTDGALGWLFALALAVIASRRRTMPLRARPRRA